jgi:SpoVK/Ycf46/Vps4 family AAA+-type ATPase
VREASVAALKEILKESEDEVTSKELSTKKRKRRAVAVGVEHFEAAFEMFAPSIGPEERKKYHALKSTLSKGQLINMICLIPLPGSGLDTWI